MAAIKRASAVGMPVTTPSAGPIHWLDGARVRLTRSALAVIIKTWRPHASKTALVLKNEHVWPAGPHAGLSQGRRGLANNRGDVVNNNEFRTRAAG